MDIYMKRLNNCDYRPCNDSDIQNSLKHKPGEVVKFSATKPRNYKFHKKYFALLRTALYHMPEHFEEVIHNEKELLYEIKKLIGFGKWVISPVDNRKEFKPDSISFANMDNYAFQDFYRNSLDVICKHIIVGISHIDFENEILNFM